MTQRRPQQQEEPPGRTDEMRPRPRDAMDNYIGSGLLEGTKALITGGDSGIGRAVAVAFAKEGADVAFCYLSEHDDAGETVRLVEQAGRRCFAFPGDLADEAHCRAVVSLALADLGRFDILVNNIATQQPQKNFDDITTEQRMRTFDVNIHSYFFMTRTKGAILAFTHSLAQALLDREIRVNCVSPGPVWTPLIPSTTDPDSVASFGEQAPMGHAAEPDDIAPSYVFFASRRLSSYYSGEVLAPVGGETLPG